MWRQSNLTLEGKIIIFSTLALSIITLLAQVLAIPNQITDAIQQSNFLEFIFSKSET